MNLAPQINPFVSLIDGLIDFHEVGLAAVRNRLSYAHDNVLGTLITTASPAKKSSSTAFQGSMAIASFRKQPAASSLEERDFKL